MALGALATESPDGIFLKAVFIPTAEAPLRAVDASAPSPAEVAQLVADRLMSP